MVRRLVAIHMGVVFVRDIYLDLAKMRMHGIPCRLPYRAPSTWGPTNNRGGVGLKDLDEESRSTIS